MKVYVIAASLLNMNYSQYYSHTYTVHDTNKEGIQKNAITLTKYAGLNVYLYLFISISLSSGSDVVWKQNNNE